MSCFFTAVEQVLEPTEQEQQEEEQEQEEGQEQEQQEQEQEQEQELEEEQQEQREQEEEEEEQQQEQEVECTPANKGEVVFLIDATVSSNGNWDMIKDMLDHIFWAIRASLSEDAIRTSLVRYNERATINAPLGVINSFDEAEDAVFAGTMDRMEGSARTGDALNVVREDVLTNARPGIPKLVILVTDGISNGGSDVVEAATRLKESGATIATVSNREETVNM